MSQISARSRRFRCDSQAVAGDVARVWLSGEIDASDARSVDQVVRDSQLSAALTILDLRGRSSIEPALVDLLAAADERAREHGCRLVILPDPGPPRAELAAMGLSARIITIEEPPAPTAGTPGASAVATEQSQDRAVIRVWGELDIATGPELAAALAVQSGRRSSTLLDLSGVEFMDSTGIRLLIQAYELSRSTGVGFELITSEAVDRTLDVAGLREHFGVVAASAR